MKITVCVVTTKKNKIDVLNLYKKLNIQTNALFCNQCGGNDTFEINNEDTKIIIKNFNDKGVSRNRNHILDNAYGDICINIDDDCPLVEDYQEIVESFFAKYPDADVVLFNGIVCKENSRPVHNKKTKKVKRFNDVSYAGGPGLIYRRDKLRSLNIRYNEKVGYPNDFYLGEDSLFMYDLVKSKCNFYRSKDILFRIEEDVDNSSYFKGVTEQYCISKGVITRIVHPRLYWLYAFYYTFKIKRWRNCHLSYNQIYSSIRLGFKQYQNIIN